MSNFDVMPSKDPNNIEPYFIVWCDQDGTNTGAATDDGELQGATIATATWTVPTGLTKDSSNQNAVTISGVSYGVNTVATIWLSAGIPGVDYPIRCIITTSDSRTLDKTIIIPVRPA
jgi:hypothetical protein